jgi:hypothetical protein
MSKAQAQMQTLLETHAKDNPLVVYTARCSYTTSKDTFIVGAHFVAHDEASEDDWDVFQAQWSETITKIRAELMYQVENDDLYEAMHAEGDYPQMSEFLRILDHGHLKADVRIVGTYLYLRIITSTDEPRKVQMARSFNKVRARKLSLDIKRNHAKYYTKERDEDGWVDYTPRDILKCPHCDDLLTDEMHISTCLDDAYEALGLNCYL